MWWDRIRREGLYYYWSLGHNWTRAKEGRNTLIIMHDAQCCRASDGSVVGSDRYWDYLNVIRPFCFWNVVRTNLLGEEKDLQQPTAFFGLFCIYARQSLRIFAWWCMTLMLVILVQDLVLLHEVLILHNIFFCLKIRIRLSLSESWLLLTNNKMEKKRKIHGQKGSYHNQRSFPPTIRSL